MISATHQKVHAACILNGKANSAKGGETRGAVLEAFQRWGIDGPIDVAQDGDETASLAHRALERGCGLVIAGGGDGTVNAVGAVLAGSGTTLGVLPLGTLNHFAKDLKIPLEIDRAVETLVSGQPRWIDAGEVNGKLFLNNSSLGLYPQIVRERDHIQRQGWSKWPAFAHAVAIALWRYRRLHAKVRLDGRERAENKTPFIFVGNNRYEVTGARIGERARLDEGRLWIYQAPHVSRMGLFAIALRSLVGQNDQRELEVFDAESVEIKTRSNRPQVSTDGEVCRLDSPLRYRIRRRALQVMVPGPTSPGEV